MATRQDGGGGGSTHSTRSTSSHRSAAVKEVAQPESQVDMEAETIDPPPRVTLRRIFTLLLVIGLLRFFLLYVLPLWTVNPNEMDPTARYCVVHKGFLYCNHDCLPRFQDEERLASFNTAHPSAANYTVYHPYIFGQSTKYCISHSELDIVWLPLQLQKARNELEKVKFDSWPILDERHHIFTTG